MNKRINERTKHLNTASRYFNKSYKHFDECDFSLFNYIFIYFILNENFLCTYNSSIVLLNYYLSKK
jgi:hypothetical protein